MRGAPDLPRRLVQTSHQQASASPRVLSSCQSFCAFGCWRRCLA